MPATPTSPFSVRFKANGHLLEANVTGRLDGTGDVIALFLVLAAEIRRTSTDRLLVLHHCEGVVPGEDGMQRLAEGMAGQGLQGVRLAYVDARGSAVGRMELGEIVGREHGYDCRVFADETRARLWLDYGER